MHENAFVPLTMAQIAREAGRHEIHLAREFRRFFGVPVGVYLRQELVIVDIAARDGGRAGPAH
jgi:AraC-like DNA-binding protein